MAGYGNDWKRIPEPASSKPVPIGRPTPQPTTTTYGSSKPRPSKPKAAKPKPKPNWAALAANPATRPKVPDAILKRVNPQAYKQRQQNRYNAAPITPGSQVTNRQLGQDTQAAIGLRYGAADNEIAKRYAQSDAMLQQIPHWFDYYRAQLQQLGLADAAARQYATDQITNLGGTMAAAASRAATADQSAMAQDAAIRGAAVDPQAAVRAQQAAQVNSANLANQAALQIQLGENSGDYWRGQEGVSEQAKIQQRLAELAYRRNEIEPDAGQLAREKGDYGTTYRADRIDKERQQILENKAFGLDEAKAGAQAAAAAQAAKDKKAQQRLAFMEKHGVAPEVYRAMTPAQRAENDRQFKNRSTPKKPKSASEKKTAADLKFFEEHGYYPPTGPPKEPKKPKPVSGPGSLTSAQENKVASQINKIARIFANGVWYEGPGYGKPATIAQLKRHMQISGVADDNVIAAAESLARNGMRGLGPHGTSAAQRAGVHVTGRWQRLGSNGKPVKKKGA